MSNIQTPTSALGIIMVQCEAIDCKEHSEVEKNVESLCQWMDRAIQAYSGADLIIFPECSTQGAHPNPDPEIYFEIPNDVMNRLAEKCREHSIWALYNVLEKSPKPETAYNATVLINAQGEIALKQRKLNLFVPLEGALPGEEIHMCEGPKGAVFGIMTCYDGDFPEVARELAMKGANILLRPACYMEPYSEQWKFVNQARAYENLAYVIAVNRVGTTEVFTWFGKSMAVDFVGRILNQAPEAATWMTKVDVYPQLANEARKEYTTCNHLWNLKHRGYVGLPPDGDSRNIYSVYRDWK